MVLNLVQNLEIVHIVLAARVILMQSHFLLKLDIIFINADL